jgi:nucleoside-diphosphate-sugar epimerase
MNKILIFGINGFLGSHFIEYIKKNEHFNNFEFIGCYKTSFKKIGFIKKYVKCDITNYNDVFNVINKSKPSYIINFAGTYHTSDFNILYTQNVIGTKNILDAVKDANYPIKKILLLGSAAEYGISKKHPIKENYNKNPVTNYGLSKLFQSELLNFYFRNFKIPYTQAIIFNVLGDGIPEDLSIGNFIKQINKAKNGDKIDVGNLNTYRDYININILISSLWYLLFNAINGENYNICSGKPQKMKNILNKLIKDSSKTLKINIDKNLLKTNDVPVIYGSNEKYNKLVRSIK